MADGKAPFQEMEQNLSLKVQVKPTIEMVVEGPFQGQAHMTLDFQMVTKHHNGNMEAGEGA